MTDLVERLVPDELWLLFRRVVPPTEMKRLQGGGRRRAGDRECLAAIIFVATSGCTWRQLPPVFGPAWPTVYRRFARWGSHRFSCMYSLRGRPVARVSSAPSGRRNGRRSSGRTPLHRGPRR
nr:MULTISPECIES: transposase [Streptomyces]